MIITPEIVQDITNNTNTRIRQVSETTTNAKYLKQRELLLKNSITSEEIYAYIGIIILLGITKKSHVPVHELWSEESIHFASFAAVALSRERFQLIAQNITFDDMSNF